MTPMGELSPFYLFLHFQMLLFSDFLHSDGHPSERKLISNCWFHILSQNALFSTQKYERGTLREIL